MRSPSELGVQELSRRTNFLLLFANVDESNQSLLQNELGTKRENVTLGVGPAPARFEGYKFVNDIVYTDWLIKSHQELTELQILYRNNEVSEALFLANGLITMKFHLTVWMETKKR